MIEKIVKKPWHELTEAVSGPMKILTLNSGSSSVKYAVFDMSGKPRRFTIPE
jgi:hypothetical protein